MLSLCLEELLIIYRIKRLDDKAVNHIIDTATSLVENKPNDLEKDKEIYVPLKENTMYLTNSNYNYAIGRMKKYIAEYVKKYGNIGED